MTIDAATLERVVAELQPLVGGRVQRVDLIADRELIFELRYRGQAPDVLSGASQSRPEGRSTGLRPGRTIRIVVSARPGLGRVHAIDDRPPRELPPGDLQRALRKRIEGCPLVAIIAEKRTVEIDVRDVRIVVRIDGGRDAIQILPPSGRAVPPMPEPATLPERFAISDELARRHGASAEAAVDRVRAELTKSLRAKRSKLEKLRANLARDRSRLEGLFALRKHGELLKTMIGRVPRGAREVTATDWETGTEVTIVLDPALGPKGNMERAFQKAKKAERGMPIVAERLAKVEGQIAALEAALTEVAGASHERLLEIGEAGGLDGGPRGFRVEGLVEPVDATASKRHPLDRWSRRFTAVDGTEIRVGKGAKENDRLTFSGARGDDLWLHASATAGAHVVLRVQKGKDPNPEALLDAAHLAAHYSGASKDSKVEVTYTEARYVKKRKGDPPGRVSVARAKTILVVVDAKRIDRLFGR